MTVPVSGAILKAPAGTQFVPEDTNIQVYYGPGDTTVATYSSPTELTAAKAAPAGTSTAILGTQGQRLDVFSTCVSTSSIRSCSPSQALITAVVAFYDSTDTGQAQLGATLAMERWSVNSANG